MFLSPLKTTNLLPLDFVLIVLTSTPETNLKRYKLSWTFASCNSLVVLLFIDKERQTHNSLSTYVNAFCGHDNVVWEKIHNKVEGTKHIRFILTK